MAITGKFAMAKELIEILWGAGAAVNASKWLLMFAEAGADQTPRELDNFPGVFVHRWYMQDNTEGWITVDGTAFYDPAEPVTPPL